MAAAAATDDPQNEEASDSDNEDYLLGVELDLFEVNDYEIKKQDMHQARLKRRQKCSHLIQEAKRNGSNGFSKYSFQNGVDSLQWFDEIGNQQGQAWECSLRLCRFLESKGRLDGCRVIELGCGLGIPGMMAARLGASSVLLSDMPDVLTPARQAVIHNTLENIVCVEPLLWGDMNSKNHALDQLELFELSQGELLKTTNCQDNSSLACQDTSLASNSQNDDENRIERIPPNRRKDGEKEMKFDLILCSDLIYGDIIPARMLVDTLLELSDTRTCIISLHERRLTGDQGSSFFDALESLNDAFQITYIPFTENSSTLSDSQNLELENEFFGLTEIKRKK